MIDVLKPLIKQFMPFAKQKMGFSRPPKLFLRQDQQNGADPMGKTGFYNPQEEAITLYISGRHPKDIMRSLAHELQHHTQKCNGDFDNVTNMGEEGYAQADPHMRSMEIQAYQASIVFRDWEDSLKETIYYEHLQKGDKSSMSTKKWKNGELKNLLTEAWGFKMDLNKLNESKEETLNEMDMQTAYNNCAQDCKKADDKKGCIQKCMESGGPSMAPMEEQELYESEDQLEEDSGREEGEHYDDNRMSDDDHIKAIEHHLDALRKDRDYDDEHIEEQSKTDREDRSGGRDEGGRRLDEAVRKLQKAGLSKRQIKEFLTKAYSKALKG